MAAGTPAISGKVVCDGCGLGTTSEHIANRLRRLELTTRYRPIHIRTVFLSAQSPAEESAFLYSATEKFTGEAAALLNALRIEFVGRDAEAVLSEFQRKGFMLTHVLECVRDEPGGATPQTEAFQKRLPAVIRKIRGSLKPKRVVVLSKELQPVVKELKAADTSVDWVLNGYEPFDLDDGASVSGLTSLLGAL